MQVCWTINSLLLRRTVTFSNVQDIVDGAIDSTRVPSLDPEHLATGHILKTLALGQMLSLFICGTAVASQYLAEQYKVNTPMLQSFINYCLLLLVYTTMLAFRKGSDVVIGDVLVLLGASFYAISNVSEEYIVKNLSRVEFLGMVGLFGTIISGLQLAIVEHTDIAHIQWNWKIVLLFVAFAFCMFGLYSFMPVVIKVTSATSVNLGILTADLYSLFFGLFLFGYKFSGLYLLSFGVIMVGFILYCSTPTRTAEEATTSLPQPASIGFDNLGLKIEENHQETPAATVQFTKEENVQVNTG
ncbi:Solute carrier family 35 member F2 [Chelonia mydas]|uniref:Solute carrier family 35 member F2 n=1 Tax=Chelonia mydas TaxID=8469 RepID=M7BJM0_CHEMY|nr:Solute carrier family 35 member F2 [Chelonia mydas]